MACTAILPADRVRGQWAALKPLLQPAIEREGTHELRDVLALLNAGRVLAIVQRAGERIRAVIVCELLVYPLARHMRVWLAGSAVDFKADWRAFFEVARQEAGRLGCNRFIAIGRQGWARVCGATRVQHLLEKDI